jgi:toxin-antitoxin system PIN domain toxin
MFLPDVNFWLALVFATHQFHPAAKQWFGGLHGSLSYFCRHTQQGFLRLANNPRAMQSAAVTMSQAWRLYDIAASDVRIAFAAEPPGLDAAWRGFTSGPTFSPKLWSDAYLAAFATLSGLEIVTFDSGFAQFQNVKATILK